MGLNKNKFIIEIWVHFADLFCSHQRIGYLCYLDSISEPCWLTLTEADSGVNKTFEGNNHYCKQGISQRKDELDTHISCQHK